MRRRLHPDSAVRGGARLVVVALLAVACGAGEVVTTPAGTNSEGLGGGVFGGQGGGPSPTTADNADDTESTTTTDGAAPEDSEVACDPFVVGEDEGEISVIYRIENGQLDGVCFGVAQPTAEEGWDTLALVVPPEQLDAVALYAAYDGETDTLAFAGPVDDDNDDFVIAIDAVAGAGDAEELQLTMVHEFAHVLTQTPDQLDLSVSLLDCTTYWNGFGCFRSGSYMAEWIAEFWPEEALATLPKKGGIDADGGYDRCVADPQFLGSYAASHPEEDFAETFSAFVFGVEVPAEVRPRLEFFERRPELVAFADRALAADRTGLSGNFDRCG